MRTALLALALTATATASSAAAQAPDTALTLGEAARLAAVRSAAATGARFRTDEYAARASESRAALFPTVSASASDGQRTFNTASFGLPFPGFDPNGQVIGPVRTTDLRGRVVANVLAPSTLGRYRSAQAAATGAGADADAVAAQAATVAASAYVRALRADAQVAAHAADSALASELLEIARAQLRAGVGVALDVTRAESQLAGLRTQLIGARSERGRAHLELLRALGLPLATTLTLRDSLATPTGPTPDLASVLDDARRSRADLRAANAAVATARRALGATRAERLPTLGLFADDGATSNSYSHLLNTYSYGVQVSLPVFDGFRVNARAAAAQAVLRQAETRARDLEVQVEVDLAVALLDLDAAREQGEASRERLRLADQELVQARDRFRAGVAGNADVIAAQLNLDAARSQHVDVLAAYQNARVSLARAQGRVTALP